MAKLMLWDAYKKYTYYVVNWKVNVLVLEKWGTNKLIVIESEELGICTTLNIKYSPMKLRKNKMKKKCMLFYLL